MRLLRRNLLLPIAGLLAAGGIAVAAILLFGGDGKDQEPPPPVIQPLALTSPADTSGFIGIDGAPATVDPAELDRILAAITGYLRGATVTPLSVPPPDEPPEAGDTVPKIVPVETYFTEAAAAQISTEDGLTLSDVHLPFASDGVSTSTLTVALGGIIQDGSAQYVNATINAVMVARGDDDITITRSGDLVLRSVDGAWKIAAYKLAVERQVGDATSTTEAAFG